jgi:hypothetical protein
MALHYVSFRCVADSAGGFRLLCDFDMARTETLSSELAFSSTALIETLLENSSCTWAQPDRASMVGAWFYVSSKQLQRLGFSNLPLPKLPELKLERSSSPSLDPIFRIPTNR